MSPINTGFEGDDFDGQRFDGLYLGKIINREDPEHLCRVKVRIPGVVDETTWAKPRGGGSKNFGKASVPPKDSDVLVQFVNGDIEQPFYEPADYGITEEGSEVFPEHDHPDVHVFGIGAFRLVVDDREGQRLARFKFVKEIAGKEEDIAWIDLDFEGNSIWVYAPSAVGIGSDGETVDTAIVSMNGTAVQVAGRKVMPSPKPIN